MEGRIVLGEESTALREKVKSLLASGEKKIILNMYNVTYIDSSGLGALVAAHTSARSQGASLKLCNLGAKFQEILQVTKLVTVLIYMNGQWESPTGRLRLLRSARSIVVEQATIDWLAAKAGVALDRCRGGKRDPGDGLSGAAQGDVR